MLRRESHERIRIQNQMPYYALTLLAAVFAVTGKLYTDLGRDTDIFLWACLIAAAAVGFLLELLVCNWQYQLSMIFRISCYLCHLGTHMNGLFTTKTAIFQWEDPRDQDPWTHMAKGTFVWGYMQAAVLYVPLLVVCAVLLILCVYDFWNGKELRSVLSLASCFVLLCGCFILLYLHDELHRRVRRARDSGRVEVGSDLRNG